MTFGLFVRSHLRELLRRWLRGITVTVSFLRQRRNLYISTGILFFLFLTKVNVSKLTVAGISFESFDNPGVFYLFLWVLFPIQIYCLFYRG